MPAPTTTGTSSIDGIPWAWEASGEGPRVCFFHGTLGSRTGLGAARARGGGT